MSKFFASVILLGNDISLQQLTKSMIRMDDNRKWLRSLLTSPDLIIFANLAEMERF
jgi:hypothetical protein